jgi:hypothetical protein
MTKAPKRVLAKPSKTKRPETSPLIEKRHFSVIILPECIERLKQTGSETIETSNAVVHLQWTEKRDRIIGSGDGCFVSEF